MSDQNYSIIVDLDGTLLKTDILHEAVLQLILKSPLKALQMPFWLLRGKAYLKSRLAKLCDLSPKYLPYRQSILNKIAIEQGRGKKIILASASNEQIVRGIAQHLGMFDGVMGSIDENLKGKTKLLAIEALLGGRKFTYYGDSSADLKIWEKSSAAVAVNPSRRMSAALSRQKIPTEVIVDRPSSLFSILRAMRVHQWSKNLLLFVPLVAGHYFSDVGLFIETALAFLAFSLLASSIYVLNDLFDLQSDRQHKTKKMRPFASGDLPLTWGFALLPLLWGGTVLLTWQLSEAFAWVLALYFLITLAYSAWIKKILLLDVITLASLYSLRVFAGGIATGITISEWLLGFCVFVFFGLALVKRYCELMKLKGSAQEQVVGRDYRMSDGYALFGLGVSSSMLSVLILVLYLNNPKVMFLYTNPERAWFMIPVVLYWLSRMWIMAHRGELHEDPVVFLLKDSVSWICLVVLSAIFYFAL